MNYLSMNLRLFVITISSTLILACGSANTFDYGNVEEDIYTNNYFQLQCQFMRIGLLRI
jgi:hypothetical protein